jgi:electron transfer flavoprotein alpha subunit
VSPKLYIALGISGSTQHIEGLKNVKDIISVNTNRHAPICSLSDMVIEGDAIEFVSKLVNKIKSEKIYNIEEINK